MTADAILRLVEASDGPVSQLRSAAKAASTVEGYTALMKRFRSWCSERSIDIHADGALAVWMHEQAWERRPSTMRRYANAVTWSCRDGGLPDPGRHPLVVGLLAAHSRHHGVAPVPDNCVAAFSREELAAIITAPLVVRGAAELAVLRNRCAILLAHHGVPTSQVIRIASDGVVLTDSAVRVSLPKVSGPGVPRHAQLQATVLELPLCDGPVDPRQLVQLSAMGPARRLLLGVASVDGGGRYSDAIEHTALDDHHRVAGLISSGVHGAVRRAGLGQVGMSELAKLGSDGFARLWRHMNPSLLTELRTRAHAAALAATGSRHDDLAHVRVETMKRMPAGLRIFVERSKTDQAGVGSWRTIHHTPGHPPTCPACVVTRWVDEAGLSSGPLFPAMGNGGRIKSTPLAVEEAAGEIQRLAARLGVDARVGTHSFRKTHATLRAEAGEEAAAIAAFTGQTPDVVLRHYVKPREPFSHAAQL